MHHQHTSISNCTIITETKEQKLKLKLPNLIRFIVRRNSKASTANLVVQESVDEVLGAETLTAGRIS